MVWHKLYTQGHRDRDTHREERGVGGTAYLAPFFSRQNKFSSSVDKEHYERRSEFVFLLLILLESPSSIE